MRPLTTMAVLGLQVERNGAFIDDETSVHAQAIEAVTAFGYAQGCATGSVYFCPNDPISRGHMATLLARAAALPDASTDYFTDDDGSAHEANINRVAEAGIATGDGAGRFAPQAHVSRAQMATFVVRAADLAPSDVDAFSDDDGNPHEENINALAAAGVTSGTADGRYRPDDVVTRGQMATFLARAFDLPAIVPAPGEQPDVNLISVNGSINRRSPRMSTPRGRAGWSRRSASHRAWTTSTTPATRCRSACVPKIGTWSSAERTGPSPAIPWTYSSTAGRRKSSATATSITGIGQRRAPTRSPRCASTSFTTPTSPQARATAVHPDPARLQASRCRSRRPSAERIGRMPATSGVAARSGVSVLHPPPDVLCGRRQRPQGR